MKNRFSQSQKREKPHLTAVSRDQTHGLASEKSQNWWTVAKRGLACYELSKGQNHKSVLLLFLHKVNPSLRVLVRLLWLLGSDGVIEERFADETLSCVRNLPSVLHIQITAVIYTSPAAIRPPCWFKQIHKSSIHKCALITTYKHFYHTNTWIYE